jgi:hypothetical protein
MLQEVRWKEKQQGKFHIWLGSGGAALVLQESLVEHEAGPPSPLPEKSNTTVFNS